MMITSLYDISKQSLKEYPDDDPFNRESWLFSYPAQCVLLIDLVKWTDGLTEAILNETNNPKKGVAHY